MRALVYPHDLHLGGSQLNAIEIAGELARRGHDCAVFGPDGPLVDRVRELGLEFVAAPPPGRRPSTGVARELAALVEHRSVDVVHGFEWPPILEAWLAARRAGRPVGVAGTVMSMAVAPFVPRSVELTVGTEQIAAAERAVGRERVRLLEPPVDLRANARAPMLDAAAQLRRSWGVAEDELTVVVVTRFARELKLEGILTAIDAVGDVAADVRVRLVLVGDGDERPVVEEAVARAEARVGRSFVVLTGALADPRPAYAAADVALGMGGSALRALAFERPLVVQGEHGYWQLLTPDTVDEFLWQGWYGYGDAPDGGRARLAEILLPLLADAAVRAELGRYGLDLVRQRFSLEAAADRAEQLYADAQRAGARTSPRELVRAGSGLAVYKVRRKTARVRGRAATDDFNARPVALTARDAGPRPAPRPPVEVRP